MKSIFLLSTGEMIEIEDNMRGGLVQSIWREIIQLENKARAKKGEEWLSYQLATQGATSSIKTCDQTKSNQANPSQTKPNQIVASEKMRPHTTTYEYMRPSTDIDSVIDTKELVREPNEYKISIEYLKSYTIETKIPDYAEIYRDEWIKFCIYWGEKGKTGKIRAEGEKTFEIKKRFATWMSRKKEQYEKTKTNKNSIITF